MLKKLLKYTGIFFLVLIVGFVALKSYGDARYFSDYDAALALNVEEKPVEVVSDTIDLFGVQRERQYRKTSFSIEARAGDRVPCTLTQPLEASGKLPTIIFVHGSGQDKRFMEEICTPFNKAGFNMVTYDQWGRGDRKIKGSDFQKATAWYVRGWKACNDARRIADYLVTRPDVDPEKLYLVGASYGAMTGTHILAHDKRFKAGVLVVGGGDFSVMLDAPLIKNEMTKAGAGWVLAMLKPVANWLGGPFDPVRSAPKTGPTPILMQNGSADTLVSPDAGKALFAALSDPKEIVWYDVDHPGLRDGDGPEVVHMLDDGLKWLQAKAGMTATGMAPAVAAVGAATP